MDSFDRLQRPYSHRRRRLSLEGCELRVMLAADMMESLPGDANRDGLFNSSDLTEVFQVGKYEDDVPNNTSWEEGDWNADGEFDSSDLVRAFQEGQYTHHEALVPDVLDVQLTQTGDGVYRVSVTLSSPYDTPERYADAWRVLDSDCNVLGIRVLTHDHQFEQPFTRSLTGVEIPDGVTEITVQGRDQITGWGGATIVVPVPG